MRCKQRIQNHIEKDRRTEKQREQILPRIRMHIPYRCIAGQRVAPALE